MHRFKTTPPSVIVGRDCDRVVEARNLRFYPKYHRYRPAEEPEPLNEERFKPGKNEAVLFWFSPFSHRTPVIGLRFPYVPWIKKEVHDLIRSSKHWRGKVRGGWLPGYNLWFLEDERLISEMPELLWKCSLGPRWVHRLGFPDPPEFYDDDDGVFIIRARRFLPAKDVTFEERVRLFEEKYVRADHSECWVWNGATARKGYGSFQSAPGKKGQAHRFAYEVYVRPIPKNFMVLHFCDNPPCVNPYHLFLGTAADNTADMLEKGRAAGGSLPGKLNPSAKLGEEDVKKVKEKLRKGQSQASVAREFGVHTSTIHLIAKGKKWKHIK